MNLIAPFSRRPATLPLLACVLLLLASSSCNSTDSSDWNGLRLDPVKSSKPLDGTATEPVEELPPGALIVEATADGTDGAALSKTESPSESKARTAEDLAHEIEKKVREAYLADLEFEIAQQKARSAEAKAAGELEEALAAEQAALEAATQYEEVESKLLAAAAQLKIDELTFQLEMAKLELEQMEREYGKFQADSHAGQTGQIVVWRETQKVDHATRRLTQEHAERNTLTSYTIPRKRRELALEVAKAQRAVERAREDLVRTEIESKLSSRQAQDKQGLLKFELAKLRAEQAGS